jgi:hypothetical protein
MQLIYDNLAAILVGTVVLLILAGIHLSSQTAGAEAGMYYMNRVQTLSLIQMIERDFPNIGAGVDPQQRDMITAYTWTEDERRFEFRAVVDTTEGAPVERIQYRVEPVDNPACERLEIQCYEVQRLADTGNGFEPSGRSNTFVTDFQIEISPQTGNLADVREIRVRLAALSAAGEASIVGRSNWETRFRPFNLTLMAL